MHEFKNNSVCFSVKYIMTKIIKYIILAIILGAIVSFAWYSGYKYSFTETKTEIHKETILQQVKNVLKLGTVEGYFSEIYSFKEHYGFNISPFQKKALIRVKAKVLVGFDMDSINIEIIQNTKSIKISNIPFPTILSIDHDLDYYDITEGTFNTFTSADYNKMNNQAKLFIKKTALNSDLLIKAQKQLEQHLLLLKSILNTYGWVVEVKKEELLD
jgi:uncharacterized protein (DUF697 family)